MKYIENQLDRHHIEVTGFFVQPMSLRPPEDMVSSRRMPDGKTRVTAGSGPGREIDRAGTGRIEVRSVRVLNEHCG